VAILGLLLALGVVLDSVLERSFVQQLTDSLAAQAREVQAVLPAKGEAESTVRNLGTALGARITIIRTDGVVLADSEHDPATMQNHRDRPEVQQALAGRVGTSSRHSATLGISFRYVALPPSRGTIVRVALPLTEVHAKLLHVRAIVAVGFLVAAAASLVVLALIARQQSRPLADVAAAVERVGHGELETEVPERGTSEMRGLARTVNRMREDVRSRIEATEAERSAREAILASLDEGIVLFDAEGAVLYRNDRAGRLLGGELAQARGLPMASLRTLAESSARGEDPPPVEVLMGPEARALQATATSISGGRVLLAIRDVTATRRLDEVRRDFVANASHELKTPAASIRALAETLVAAAESDPEAVPRFAIQLEREAVRLARIVGDLLDLSRLEVEPFKGVAIRLDAVVREETDRLRERADADGIELEVETRPATVQGSARELSLMARNLIENAIQYTRSGGRVDVTVAVEDGEALLTVRDTGIGIPGRDLGRIFERFYRVDRARSRATGGTGLGLSIVKHVAESHGGTVEVASSLGEGSTFTVRLRRAS
jgi:two-component system phosphate regulon sensor histidine kinase PhoR